MGLQNPIYVILFTFSAFTAIMAYNYIATIKDKGERKIKSYHKLVGSTINTCTICHH